jgi:hypothetical protein
MVFSAVRFICCLLVDDVPRVWDIGEGGNWRGKHMCACTICVLVTVLGSLVPADGSDCRVCAVRVCMLSCTCDCCVWVGRCVGGWVGGWMGGCITSSAASSVKSLGVEVALKFFVLERLIPIVACGFQKLASVIQDLRGDHLWQWCERSNLK